MIRACAKGAQDGQGVDLLSKGLLRDGQGVELV